MQTSQIHWFSETLTGNIIGIIGVFISIVGFIIAILQLNKTRSAAVAAQHAAEMAKSEIFKLDTIYECATAVGILEEISRHARTNSWALIPDRLSSAKQNLIQLKAKLAASQNDVVTKIETTITRIGGFESLIGRHLAKGTAPPDIYRFTMALSAEIHSMSEILSYIRVNSVEVNHD